jgi:two-component system, NarL family, nitrate/nitrite response regulator NarL
VLKTQNVTEHDGEALSLVSMRSAPRVYVMDATGDVLLRGVDERSLSAAARATVMKLIASDPGADVLLGLAGPGQAVRLVRLRGAGRSHYALFLERLAVRSPVDVAVERFGLSEREREVLEHLVRGATTAANAQQKIIADSTVATHARNIGVKMNVSKRKEIVAAVLGGR